MLKPQTIFGPGLGGPSNYYRIPSIITTKSGTLVACADARYCSAADNPNRIDKVVRRSTDGGESWGDFILAVSEQGTEQLESSAAIDPVMVYVAAQNRIYLLYCHTPAGIGIRNCAQTIGEDANGQRPPNDAPTAYLMICHSDDEGLTWSAPRSLNHQVKKDYMSFLGPGPGIGIVKQHAPHQGRILIPVYYGTRVWPLQLSCCVIYSDDGGENWRMGESPNNTRFANGVQLCDRSITETQMLTESQLIEQADGTLKYFMRNHDDSRCVATACSHDGGASWTDFRFDPQLPQPICQLSVLTLADGRVVFLNPASREERKDGVLRLSLDGGETFAHSRLFCKGDFVYSCMTQLSDGRIGILYEPTGAGTHIDFAIVSAEWIQEG
ncbi:MAG: exo-alpha-sialidase [Lachnospiraceae bacterium]|jgi:sialidase-1|nr:exo-alpha-sialidase [Lachnospiraceae bacterium]